MYWLKKLQLYEAGKESLYNETWLTDNIIDVAQVLLRKAYHHIGGLEPNPTIYSSKGRVCSNP